MSNELLKNSLGIEFPIRPIKGVSMLFETEHQLFKNNVWFKNLYIAPRKMTTFLIALFSRSCYRIKFLLEISIGVPIEISI